MNCPDCGKEMKNLGNISGIVMTSSPPQWYETYACDDCKVKKVVHISGKPEPNYVYLKDYAQR